MKLPKGAIPNENRRKHIRQDQDKNDIEVLLKNGKLPNRRMRRMLEADIRRAER